MLEYIKSQRWAISAGVLALGAWLVSQKREDERVREAVEDWFEENSDPQPTVTNVYNKA